MNERIIKKRYETIFKESELKRITSKFVSDNLLIVVDVHKLSCKEAARFINNIINLTSCSFRLVVIHGYNRGTAIRDMLTNDFKNDVIEVKYVDPYNPGITHIQVA